MGTFYFLLLIIIALVGYAISSIYGKEVVRGVEAGPVGECDPRVVREKSFRARPIEVRDLDKIRIFDRFDEYHQLLTCRYSGDKPVISSLPHTREPVLGVVKYKL